MSREVPVGTIAVRRRNRRGRLRRLMSWLPTRWYPVDLAARRVYNVPCRQVWQVYALFGLEAAQSANGKAAAAASLGWPGLPLLQACILAVLADRGPARRPELMVRLRDLRERRGWGGMPLRGSLYSAISAMRGLIERTRTPRGNQYAIAHAALATRRPCPIIAMRGHELAAVGFRTFERAELPAREAS